MRIKLLLIFSALSLVACSGGDSSCTTVPSTPDEPDVTGAITVTPATVAANGMVIVNVPVDAGVLSLNVTLHQAVAGPIRPIAGSANMDIVAPGAQIAAVPVPIGGTVAAADYFPTVLLCSGDQATCLLGLGGTQVVYTASTDLGSDYNRATLRKNGVDTASGAEVWTAACMPFPLVTVQ